MMQAWGRIVARFRWWVIAAAAAGFAAAGIIGPGVFGNLTGAGFDTPGSEAARALERIEATVGRQDTDVVAVYRSDTLTVDDPGFRDAVQRSLGTLTAEDVDTVLSYYDTGSPDLVTPDRHATYAVVRLAADDLAEQMSVYQDAEKGLHDTGPDVRVDIGGITALDVQINDQVSADLAKAEQLSLPVLAVLLVIVFGSAVAAGLPVLIGGMTVLGSFVVLRTLTLVTDVSVFAINIITILGLGLAVDYGLFLVSRFREELRPDVPVPDALARTMATAGRTVAFSAVTVAVSLSGLMLFPQLFLRSMGFGGIAAVTVAAVTALTVLPAALAVLGHRVDALRLRLPRFLRRSTGRDREHGREHGEHGTTVVATPGAGPSTDTGRWDRFARLVMRRPIAFAGVTVAVLVLLGTPFLHVRFGGIDERALPADAEGRLVSESLADDFHAPTTAPINVLVEGGDTAAVQGFADRIADLPGAEEVTAAARSQNATLLTVDYPGDALGSTARTLLTDIRGLSTPDGTDVLVGGLTAENTDLRASVGGRLPLMAALVVATTFVLLFLAFGSFVLPIKAVLMNVLSLGASFGVVTWIFADGHLAGLLHFTSTGTVETTQPILMLAILFGLSMDYEVFLLSRIREQYEREGDNTAAVAHGLQRTGQIITSAALLLIVVIAAFSTSGITFIKLIGVGMAVAIAVDATLVRAVLVPATMRLLGRWNWWAPGPLQRWQARYGWTEAEERLPAAGPAATAGPGTGAASATDSSAAPMLAGTGRPE
ncbi:MAG: MMPL family transporter [Kineosporiaceae bacterium]